MTPTTPNEQDVLDAAAAIVDAFSANDGERYFSLFAPDATFVFHTEQARLDDRAAYERLWRDWVASGWRVTSCSSSAQRVQLLPGGAVFSHSVSTSVDTPDGPDSYQERETIVFRSEPNGLIAIHEHLSPQP
ncbi:MULTISPECIES: nuclear transport factor 2 family protein [unclassified Salinibacterium]|uniref:YybH family protein n=1 Tax=unclassified Salinibacterium TaxID=2632331 RepID=UPI001421924C|nr:MULTISPECIES: nuclear transport factor 2 family protein [unclassified Salinibacterium]